MPFFETSARFGTSARVGTSARAAAAVTLSAALGAAVVIGPAGSAHAGTVRDPGSPGCVVNDFRADHTSGVVWWDISCDAPRSVAVDATASHGTADDHEIVDHQVQHATVGAGETWHGVAVFPIDTTPSTDQISAQAVSFVTDDPAERPAILGRVNG